MTVSMVTKQVEFEWVWFLFGMLVYMLKRAYYLVNGPNPVANNYLDFIKRCWIPLFVRSVVDSCVFWLTFYPNLLTPILKYFGWDINVQYSLLHIGPAAVIFGLGVDSVVDFAVTKIPFIKDWLPQMPPPLPRSTAPPVSAPAPAVGGGA